MRHLILLQLILIAITEVHAQNPSGDSLMTDKIYPFALYGSEKMVYDKRMGPQAILYKGKVYVVYQSDSANHKANPYIISYDVNKKEWSKEVRVGETSPDYDHHFAPVIWIDNAERIHILYNCHIMDGGIHLISKGPLDLNNWLPGPTISSSISYPHLFKIYKNKLLLYYRRLGHMGFWGYQLSDDGGMTWSAFKTVTDFDQNPETDLDTWACTYESVEMGDDLQNLHIGFVHYDERQALNPKYNSRLRGYNTLNRYHLYYAKLNIPSGRLYTIDNIKLEYPLNRRKAEICKVVDKNFRMDTVKLLQGKNAMELKKGHALTTIPTIIFDSRNQPGLLLPITKESPWNSDFTYFKRVENQWVSSIVTSTNNQWSESILEINDDKLTSFLISGKSDGEPLPYGGGALEAWKSSDNGSTWSFNRNLDPEKGLIYNNPKAILDWTTGKNLKDSFIIYGWEDEKMTPREESSENKNKNIGKAFLRLNGQWVSGMHVQ